MSQRDIIGLLGRVARQVYWTGDLSAAPELRAFLYDQQPAVTREDFISPKTLGRLRLGFGGISADKTPGGYVNITDGRFDPFVREVVSGLKGTLGSVIFGGTYWSFMPELARIADREARATLVGVMPQQGLADLLAVLHLFDGANPVPMMDYLAIAGETYSDPVYTSFMAACLDGYVSLGGRTGARAEVQAVLGGRKPVFLAPLGLSPDEDWISEEVLAGLTFCETTEDLINLIRLDYRPSTDGINSPGLSFRRHVSPHTFRTTNHGDDIVVGVVSTSGATTDTHRLYKILSPLLRGIDKTSIAPERVIGLGGMTAMGGIHVFYEACLEAAIDTAGIMPWIGTGNPLFRGAQEMIISGKKWGDESKAFTKMVDVLIVVEPGDQGWREAVEMARDGGPLGQKIPVIVIRDPVFARGRPHQEIPGAEVFEVHQLDQAINALNAAIARVRRERVQTLATI